MRCRGLLWIESPDAMIDGMTVKIINLRWISMLSLFGSEGGSCALDNANNECGRQEEWSRIWTQFVGRSKELIDSN